LTAKLLKINQRAFTKAQRHILKKISSSLLFLIAAFSV